MKTIQKLVRYDTDMATEVTSFGQGYDHVVLCRTANNNWFTYQEGANSFESLTEVEAALKVESWGLPDVLERVFGHLIKDA